MSSTTLTYAIQHINQDLIIPFFISTIAVAWISDLAIKAMKSEDLT